MSFTSIAMTSLNIFVIIDVSHLYIRFETDILSKSKFVSVDVSRVSFINNVWISHKIHI